MTNIVEMPDSDRLAMRQDIESVGAEVVGYQGDAMLVALPTNGAVFAGNPVTLEAKGYRVSDLYYFPLGSDKPAARLRHDGRYPGSKGFWLYALVRKVNPSA